MKSRSADQRGFTLIELIIVIVVIAILAVISFVVFSGLQNRAHGSAAQAALAQTAKKLDANYATEGVLPADETELGNLIGDTSADIQYSVDGDSYCITATSGTVSYFLSRGGSASPGACDGHTSGSPPVVAITCPSNFIVVPGNSTFGTSDFCVMKYEAKNVGGVATSQASGTAWTSISQTSAITTSQAACDGCHLITEAEWMTLATNIAGVANNWSGGAVGSGFIYNGHNREPPTSAAAASTNDDDGTYLMSNITASPGGNNRRTLYLSNGEVIWDLVGNAWEWTQGTIAAGQQPGVPGQGTALYKQWNDSAINWSGLPAVSRPSTAGAAIAGYSSDQGIGQLYTNPSANTDRAFLRSGGRKNGAQTGIFTLVLDHIPSATDSHIGFRVTK